jgi:predicted protein tyrosine phosphatase
MKNLLFVCSQNKLRSPTAEAVFSGLPSFDVRSAGLNNNAEIPLGLEDILWADFIFVMEPIHKRKLRQRFKEHLTNQKLICLDIPDNYEYMESELIGRFRKSVPQYIGLKTAEQIL